jgi:predicted RecA/RadA family phage recombinase
MPGDKKNAKAKEAMMVTETGLKLRTKLESAKTLRATTDSTTTHSAGDMVVVGDTLGVVVEDVGTSSDFVLVYEAEKIVVPKASDVSLSAGDAVYFDAGNAAVTDVSTGNAKCGRALEAVGTTDDEVLIDLMVIE